MLLNKYAPITHSVPDTALRSVLGLQQETTQRPCLLGTDLDGEMGTQTHAQRHTAMPGSAQGCGENKVG